MEWLNYLLKVSACLALFFAIYLLVLRRLTFFKINRFYLLGSLVLSFIIPALHFTIEKELPPVAVAPVLPVIEASANIELSPAEVTPMQIPAVYESFDWLSLLPVLYAIIAVGFLGLAIWRLFQLLKHSKAKSDNIDGLKLVFKDKGFTNCSFFNYVFVDQSLSQSELVVLLNHEAVHAKQLHSIDKILLMLIKAILWFNPIVYLYDKALEEVHEYEADETTSQNVGTEIYANLLLKLAVNGNNIPLAHNFVKSPIKQRIKMLFNTKSKQMKKLMYLMALPIGLGLLWGFTIDVVDVLPSLKNEEKVFTLVLDAGHGGKDKGAVINGYTEKDIALTMANKIKQLAEAKGIKVITTRSTDQNVSISDRAKAEGTILISLHVNAEPTNLGGKSNGIEMFTAPVENDAMKVAKANSISYYVYKGMQHIQGINIKEAPKQVGLALLRGSKMPGIVLELGYLTNKNDFQFITNEDKQNQLAEGIVNGILVYKEKTPTDQELEIRAKLYQKGNSGQSRTDQPFIEKTTITNTDGLKRERVVVNAPGRPLTLNIGYNKAGEKLNLKLWFYVEGKLYSEAEAEKFDGDFIKKLSTTNGSAIASDYTIEGVESSFNNYVFWFGTEPKFSPSNLRNREIFGKYNNTTVNGEVLGFTYSSSDKKLVDGFLVQTTAGEIIQANVEFKFTKEISAMVSKGDKVSLKIYNANYWPSSKFPVVVSYKLMKKGKLLFDRWPRTTTVKSSSATELSTTATAKQRMDKEFSEAAKNLKTDEAKLGLLGMYVIKANQFNSSYFKQVATELKKKGFLLSAKTKLNGAELVELMVSIKSKRNSSSLSWEMDKEDPNPDIVIEINSLTGANKINLSPKKNQKINPVYAILDQAPAVAYNLLSKINYSASDSVRTSRMMDHMLLYGKVKLNLDGYQFSAKVVDVGLNSNIITAHFGTLTNSNGLKVTADLIEFDYLTKKYTTKDNVYPIK